MKLRIIDTLRTRQIISWIQIIGGITGIISVSKLTLGIGTINGALLFILLTGYSLFSFSIYTGIKLLNDRTQKLGMILTNINQILQIVQVKFLGYGLTYSVGIELCIGFERILNLDFAILASDFSMFINVDEMDFVFMINIIPIFLIIVISDIWRELYKQDKVTADKLEVIEVLDDSEESTLANKS